MKLRVYQRDFLPVQWAFLTSTARIKGFVGGMGSGKTYIFLRETLLNFLFRKNRQGHSNGWIIYPTYELAEELFVQPFSQLLENTGIPYSYNIAKHRFESPYGRIKIYQLVKPQLIVGTELTFIGFDEFDVASWSNCEIAFQKALGRLRGSEDARLYITTTPEGIHYTHKIFVTDNPDGGRFLVRAKTRENPYLPEGYIENLENSYPPRLLEAYLNGEFVNLTQGQLYYNFERAKFVKKLSVNSGAELYLTCDFNKSPMEWLVAQREGNKIQFVTPISIKYDAKTKQAAEIFCQLFKHHECRKVIVTGDAAGQWESQRDYSSDYQIIKETLELNKWQVIFKVPNHNPSINNRVNLTTTLFHKDRIRIDESCVSLILDYEQVVGDGKGGKDKSNATLTHASDAADYLINLLFAGEFNRLKIRQV